MKKKVIISVSTIGLFLIIIIGIIVLSSKEQETQIQQRQEVPLSKEYTISCTSSEKTDDVKQTEIVYIKNNILITRTDISTWNKENPDNRTCTFYQKRVEKMNALEGISSTVTCDSTSGTYTTIYTIAEMNREITKLNEFNYLEENDKFDFVSWVDYMKSHKYTCEKSGN